KKRLYFKPPSRQKGKMPYKSSQPYNKKRKKWTRIGKEIAHVRFRWFLKNYCLMTSRDGRLLGVFIKIKEWLLLLIPSMFSRFRFILKKNLHLLFREMIILKH